MKINSVESDEFAFYGEVLAGLDTGELCSVMEAFTMPDEGVMYQPGLSELESCAVFNDLNHRFFGGLDIQIGLCWGYNSVLNCLEYHRSSEILIGSEDFILLLARRGELEGCSLDTAKVRGFLVPSGCAVELYSSTLHYAPCHTSSRNGFRTAVILPRGTNTYRSSVLQDTAAPLCLSAVNKWVIAHQESPEAAEGAFIGLIGKNIDVGSDSSEYME